MYARSFVSWQHLGVDWGVKELADEPWQESTNCISLEASLSELLLWPVEVPKWQLKHTFLHTVITGTEKYLLLGSCTDHHLWKYTTV